MLTLNPKRQNSPLYPQLYEVNNPSSQNTQLTKRHSILSLVGSQDPIPFTEFQFYTLIFIDEPKKIRDKNPI